MAQFDITDNEGKVIVENVLTRAMYVKWKLQV